MVCNGKVGLSSFFPCPDPERTAKREAAKMVRVGDPHVVEGHRIIE